MLDGVLLAQRGQHAADLSVEHADPARTGKGQGKGTVATVENAAWWATVVTARRSERCSRPAVPAAEALWRRVAPWSPHLPTHVTCFVDRTHAACASPSSRSGMGHGVEGFCASISMYAWNTCSVGGRQIEELGRGSVLKGEEEGIGLEC